MHLMQISNLINKIADQQSDMYQSLVDLVTLGYRDGLIQGKIEEIAATEDLSIAEVRPEDISPEEMQEIVDTVENWFRMVMAMSTRLRANPETANIDAIIDHVRNHTKNSTNRVQVALEDIANENPGLFD